MTEYICSECSAETVEVYNSSMDSGNNNLFSLPENLHELSNQEANVIRRRNKDMIELLEKLNEKKRLRIISSIEDGKLIIVMVCPNCRRVYDSRSLAEKSHQQGSLPIRKPSKRIVSDDIDSIREATETEFDDMGGQDVYVYSQASQQQLGSYENKKSITDSRFFDEEVLNYNIPYVVDELRKISDRSDKQITGVKVRRK